MKNIGGLMALMFDNVDIGKNPNHHTFGKLIIDNGNGTSTIYDVLGGMAQVLRLAALIPAALYSDGQITKSEVFNLKRHIYNFRDNKTSPALSAAIALSTGTTYGSDEQINRFNALAQSYLPIVVQNMKEYIDDPKVDLSSQIINTVLDMVGIPNYTLLNKELINKNGNLEYEFKSF